MNDLDQNRIRRLENQVNAVITQLRCTNADLMELFDEIYSCYDPDAPRAIELARQAESIRVRIQALATLTPREVRY